MLSQGSELILGPSCCGHEAHLPSVSSVSLGPLGFLPCEQMPVTDSSVPRSLGLLQTLHVENFLPSVTSFECK